MKHQRARERVEHALTRAGVTAENCGPVMESVSDPVAEYLQEFTQVSASTAAAAATTINGRG